MLLRAADALDRFDASIAAPAQPDAPSSSSTDPTRATTADAADTHAAPPSSSKPFDPLARRTTKRGARAAGPAALRQSPIGVSSHSAVAVPALADGGPPAVDGLAQDLAELLSGLAERASPIRMQCLWARPVLSMLMIM
jgi:hypothetical protein